MEDNGTVFTPRDCLHQKVAMGMENLKMQSLPPCNKRTGRYGKVNNLVSCMAYILKNKNLGIFEAVEDNGNVFQPSQFLHQKVAMGIENLKMQSLSQCNKRTGRYGPANNLVSRLASRPKNGNLGIFEGVEANGTVFAPSQCLHQRQLWVWRT